MRKRGCLIEETDMKLFTALTLGALAFTAMAAPAAAQRAHTTTTVTKVGGPLKILPHHKRKICRVTTVHHHRTKKCWYH
jgi:hypothetical protein